MPSHQTNESKSKSTNENQNRGDIPDDSTTPSPLHGVASSSHAIRRNASRTVTPSTSQSTPSASTRPNNVSSTPPTADTAAKSRRVKRGHCTRKPNCTGKKITLKEMIQWGKYFREQDAATANNDGDLAGGDDLEGSYYGSDAEDGRYDVDLEELDDLASNFGETSDEEEFQNGMEEDDGIGEQELDLLLEYGLEEDFDDEAKENKEMLAFSDHCASMCNVHGLLNDGHQSLGQDEGQTNTEESNETYVYVPVDIEHIPKVPQSHRYREWIKTPALASTLDTIDVIVQEAELVRLYLSMNDIETATPVGDQDITSACTICTAKNATRAIVPCGHLVCTDCMTHMILNRCMLGGVAKAKECAVCKMAVGFFVFVKRCI